MSTLTMKGENLLKVLREFEEDILSMKVYRPATFKLVVDLEKSLEDQPYKGGRS